MSSKNRYLGKPDYKNKHLVYNFYKVNSYIPFWLALFSSST